MEVRIIRSIEAQMSGDEWGIMLRALSEFANDRSGNHRPDENMTADQMGEALAKASND